MFEIPQVTERNYDCKVSILAELWAEIGCNGSHYQPLAFRQHYRHLLLVMWGHFPDHKKFGRRKENDLMNGSRFHGIGPFQEDKVH